MAKDRIIYSFLWQYGERLIVQGISFIVTLVLARLLMPEEYGIVSIAMIYITLLEVFVTSGWGNALVQKKNATSKDFSTIFYFNIIFSLLLFGLMVLLAPIIGRMYEKPVLTSVITLMSFRIVIGSFNTIQQAYVQRKLLFKRLFYSSLAGTCVSAVLGVLAACYGLGVYALVIQYLSSSLINTIVLFVTIDWRPTLEFSWDALKTLVSYGWKLLGSGLLNTAFAELKGFVIGSKYTSADLAYYDKGRQFPSLIYENVNTSIGKVLFPLMSQAQDDKIAIQKMTGLSLKVLATVLLPILMILFAVGDSLIELLLTEKWLPAVPFLRITCLTYSLVIVNTVFTNAINAMGKSDIHLKVEILNIVSGIVILLLFMNAGTIYIALSVTISNLLCAITRVMICKKLLDYHWSNFITDFILPYVLSSLMLIVILFAKDFRTSIWWKVFCVPIIGIITDIILVYLFNKPVLVLLKECFYNLRKHV